MITSRSSADAASSRRASPAGAVNGSKVDTLGGDNAAIYAYARSRPRATRRVATAHGQAPGIVLTAARTGATRSTTPARSSASRSTATRLTRQDAARIEGLDLNRKRYLRAVATPAFTGGTSPGDRCDAEIVFGGGTQVRCRSRRPLRIPKYSNLRSHGLLAEVGHDTRNHSSTSHANREQVYPYALTHFGPRQRPACRSRSHRF